MTAGRAETGDDVVHAAGGVVWRRRRADLEVLLVHRPKYDDWTFPKGKLEPGEVHDDAARREVLEETGLRCALGPELEISTYTDGKGRPKVVRYWMMEVEDGAFSPNDEVDEMRWLSLDRARRRLSYGRDLPVLDSFERTHPDVD